MTVSVINEESEQIILKIFAEKPKGSLSKIQIFPKINLMMFEVYSINTHELGMLWHMFGDMNIRMIPDCKTAMIRIMIQGKYVTTVPEVPQIPKFSQ